MHRDVLRECSRYTSNCGGDLDLVRRQAKCPGGEALEEGDVSVDKGEARALESDVHCGWSSAPA